MNLFLPIRPRHAVPKHVAVAAGWVALVLIAGPVRPESALARTEQTPKGRLAQSRTTSPPARLPRMIGDVALRPGGVLEGEVVCGENGAHGAAAAGLPVALLRASQTVATTVTDAQGKFTFGNLRGGLYRVVIHTSDQPCWRFYRFWASHAAPPHASDRVRVLVGRRLVRGQSPLPIVRLPRGATIAAIAAGAIVPPIIYCGVKRDGQVPASP